MRLKQASNFRALCKQQTTKASLKKVGLVDQLVCHRTRLNIPTVLFKPSIRKVWGFSLFEPRISRGFFTSVP